MIDTDREDLQIRVGRSIEKEVLPYYRKPFPRFPRARDATGRYRRIAAPFFGTLNGRALSYKEYADYARRGARSYRTIHGPIHATRVALWAGLLWVLFERYALRRSANLFELQMAAAFHDAARQDEGKERWEQESTWIYRRWLRGSCADAERAMVIYESVSSPPGSTILQDADTLEILRVLPFREFDAARLSFWNDPRIPSGVQLGLIDEVHAFITTTEESGVKHDLEESGALYFNVMHLIVDACRRFHAFCLLRDLLGQLAGQES